MKRLLFIIFSILSIPVFAQVNLPDGIHVLNPKPPDDRQHFSTRVAAWAGVSSSRRYPGLTVFIDSANAEYWWKYGNLTNAGLVLKTVGGGSGWALSGTTNLTGDALITSANDVALEQVVGTGYSTKLTISETASQASDLGMSLNYTAPSGSFGPANNNIYLDKYGITLKPSGTAQTVTLDASGSTSPYIGIKGTAVFITKPTINDTITHLLTYENSTGKVKLRNVSSISGGGGWGTSGSTTVTSPHIVGVPKFDNIIFDSATSVSRIQFKSKQSSSYGDYWMTLKDNNFGDTEHDQVFNLGFNTNGSGGRQNTSNGAVWFSMESHFNGISDDDFEIHMPEVVSRDGTTNVRVLSMNIAKDMSNSESFWHIKKQEWRPLLTDNAYFSIQDGTTEITNTGGGQVNLNLVGSGGTSSIVSFNDGLKFLNGSVTKSAFIFNNDDNGTNNAVVTSNNVNASPGPTGFNITTPGRNASLWYYVPSNHNSFLRSNDGGNWTFYSTTGYVFDNSAPVQITNLTTAGVVTTDASGNISSSTFAAASSVTPTSQAGGRNLVSGDNGTIIVTSNTSPISITIPTGLTTGFFCRVAQGASGAVTVSGTGGTTVVGSGGTAITTNAGDIVEVYCTGSNTYLINLH